MKVIEPPEIVNGIYAFVLKNAKKIADEITKIIADSHIDEGGIIFIYGPVGSGKSLVAIDLHDNIKDIDLKGRKPFFCQPLVDRSDVPKEKILSRSGRSLDVFSYENKSEIEKMFHENDIVVIDEIHFTPVELQSYLMYEIKLFVERGGWLIALGLLPTSQGGEFVLSALLTYKATKIYNLYSTCQMCGRKAYKYSQRLIDGKVATIDEPELLPPSTIVSYEARCEDCFVVKR
jgi:thymidine kinase